MSHRLSRVMAIALVIGLLAALVPMVALAQTTTKAPGTWVSSINIQNPTDAGGEAANVSINFYTADGTLALSFPLRSAIADGGSRSIFVPSEVPNLADGQYSAVIQSNVPLLVVANSSSTAPSTAGAYNGIDAAEAGTCCTSGTYNDYYGSVRVGAAEHPPPLRLTSPSASTRTPAPAPVAQMGPSPATARACTPWRTWRCRPAPPASSRCR